MKSFEVKVYSRTGVFKKTINPLNITSEIEFSEELEGGQSDLTIQFKGEPSDYMKTDIVEIREVDETNYAISRTFTGIVEESGTEETATHTVVSLFLLGGFTALNDKIFKQGGLRAFTSTATPGNLVKLIIDSFNAQYGTLAGDVQNLSGNLIRYTASSIDVTGSSVSYEFDNDSCLEALKKVLDKKGLSFYIGSDGVCHVQQDSGQSRKSLTLGREVMKIFRKEHKRDMCNKLYHERASSVEQTYTDAVSIVNYGDFEKKVTDADILDATTQNTFGNEYISDFANPRNEISILTKPLQSESVLPGMLLSVNNTNTPLVDKKITKITKGKDSWTIYVGDFISFGKTVLKK